MDEDGVPDYIEADPVNITEQQNATIAEYVKTHNETSIEKQFNPLMRENIPPLIEDMSVKSKENWGWCGIIPCVTHSWTEIRVRIFDVSSYTVEIKVLDNGKYETFSGWGNQTFAAFIDIDYWSDTLLDYKVRVTAVDEAGNELVMEKEIEGFFGGILEFLADIWDAIVGAIMAAWEAVVAAMNFLIEIIKRVIQVMMDRVIQPVVNEIATWFKQLLRVVIDSIDHVSASDVVTTLGGLILGSNILMLAMAIIVAIQIIFTLTKAVGIGTVIEMASSLVTGVIVSALVGTLIYELAVGPGALENAIPQEVNAGISTTFSIMGIILALGVWAAAATRPLKTAARFMFVSTALFITALAIEMGRTMVIKEETKDAYKKALVLDVVACALSAYAWLDIKPHSSLARRWYPALGALDDAFGIIAIAVSGTALASDINGYLRS